ncbi:hypothetical protein NDU88_008965 [Pleurodeles waltl]|uniref:Uncharacterized protein n=1 Tax=Pleurodeles waltl TaxID=8319 RepID=A0AAV7QTA6_PLEWA|nr:hypothetical protein NDU88_008965 [Pleurodeles waltl]
MEDWGGAGLFSSSRVLIVAPAPAAASLAFFEFSEKGRVTALPGSRDTFPGALLVLALPGFPRRGILAEPLRARRSSSAARPQCRSLPPGGSSNFRRGWLSENGVSVKHIQPISPRKCHAPLGFCGSNERCCERVFGAAGVPLERLCIPFEDTSSPTEGARCVFNARLPASDECLKHTSAQFDF